MSLRICLALVALYAIAIQAEDITCPKWACSADTPKEYCYKLDKEKNTYNVKESDNSICSILPFADDPTYSKDLKISEVQNVAAEELYEKQLKPKYCGDTDFDKDFFECDKWVRYENQFASLKKKRNVYYDEFQESKPDVEDKKTEWEVCKADSECSSLKCKCVPSTGGVARCTTSVYDDLYEDFFQEVCVMALNPEADGGCKFYIQTIFAHIIKALEENAKAKELTCLQTFGDVNALLQIKQQLSSGNTLLWIIIAVVFGLLIAGCIAYACYSSKKQVDPQDDEGKKSLVENQHQVV